MEKKQSKLKKRLMALAFILFNAAVIAVSAMDEFGRAGSIGAVTVEWRPILMAAACFAAGIAVETLKVVLMMRHAVGRSSVKTARQMVLLGRYYDNVTPAAIGGQPFQILHLKNHGFSGPACAAIPLGSFMAMQFSFVLIAVGLFMAHSGMIASGTLRVTCWIGLLFYAALPVVILLSTFFPGAMARMSTRMVRLLHKIRLVRNPDETAEKARVSVTGYCECLKGMLGHKLFFAAIMLLSLIYQIAIASIPYFVLRAFGGDLSYLACLVTTFAINASIAFVPTPGNAGAAEGSFYMVFGRTAESGFWPMLTWRFLSYYAFILLGLLVYLELWIDGRRAARKAGRDGTPAADPEAPPEDPQEEALDIIKEELEDDVRS